MKLKYLVLFFTCLISQKNYAAEEQSAVTTELIKTFVKEGKEKSLGWCACKSFQEPTRIIFTEQLINLYTKNYKKDLPLVVTFFASGYRFLQEYTILRSLSCVGFQHITPIFIDPKFKETRGLSGVDQFEKIINEHPFIKKRYYFGSSKEYLDDLNAPKTDLLTTIDIKYKIILENYQDILDKKMSQNGQSACVYIDYLKEIRQKQKEQKALAEIQRTFIMNVEF